MFSSHGLRTILFAVCTVGYLLPFKGFAQAGGGAIYRFDEGYGIVANDSSGAGNYATLNGPTFVPGHGGSGLHFSAGGTNTVVIPQSVLTGFTNTAYFEAWIRPNSYNGSCGFSQIFRKYKPSYRDWWMMLWQDGSLQGSIYGTDGSGVGARSAPGVIPLQVWTKVAMWYDGSVMHLLVNDAEVAQGLGIVTPDWSGNNIIQLGNNSIDNNCDYSYDGDMDDVTIAPSPTNRCNLRVDLAYNSGNLTMNFDIGTTGPATWNVWLSSTTGLTKLFTKSLPTLPERSVTILKSIVPAGILGVLTTLSSSPGGVSCSDWRTVYSY